MKTHQNHGINIGLTFVALLRDTIFGVRYPCGIAFLAFVFSEAIFSSIVRRSVRFVLGPLVFGDGLASEWIRFQQLIGTVLATSIDRSWLDDHMILLDGRIYSLRI